MGRLTEPAADGYRRGAVTGQCNAAPWGTEPTMRVSVNPAVHKFASTRYRRRTRPNGDAQPWLGTWSTPLVPSATDVRSRRDIMPPRQLHDMIG